MASIIEKITDYFWKPSLSTRYIRSARRNLAKARQYYEGARISQDNPGWSIISTDANNEVRPAMARLRDVSRNMIRNNGHASHARNVIATNTVGNGIIPTIICEKAAVKAKLEALLEEFFDTTACDATGKMDFYGLQNLAVKTIFESGEVLIRIRLRKASDNLPVPFQLEVLEPDYLNQFVDGPQSNGNRAVAGVEFDALNRIVGYHLFKDHPGSMWSPRIESTFVPADLVLHIFRVDRPGQARGIPWMAPVIVKMGDFHSFSYAQLVRQKIAACFAVFITGDSDASAINDLEAGEKYHTEELAPGLIQRLRNGETVQFGTPPPVTDFDQFAKVSLREIAAGLDISYEVLTGDLTGVNFSSGRMGWIEFQRQISSWHNHMLLPQMMLPIGKKFLQLAYLMGEAKPTDKVKLKWTPPKREMISPKDEVPYIIQAIRSGLTTRDEELRKLGFDPEKVDAEAKAINDRVDKLGLIFDSDARHRSQVGNLVSADQSGGGIEGSADKNSGKNDVGASKTIN